VSPYQSYLTTVDDVNLVAEYRCDTPFWGYYIIELGFLLITALYGIFVIYQAWNLTTQANQVKWILITTYNFILTFMVFGPLFVFETDERSRAIMAAFGTLFLSLQSELCFFLPSFLYQAVKESIRSSGISAVSRHSKKNSSNSANLAGPNEAAMEPAQPIQHPLPKANDEKTEESDQHPENAPVAHQQVANGGDGEPGSEITES